MTELGVKLPATTLKPEPTRAGYVVHSYIDTTMYQGQPIHMEYITAAVETRDELLHRMPEATVTFYELTEGEPFFDTGVEDD